MAIYSTNFSEATIGADPPVGWTEKWDIHVDAWAVEAGGSGKVVKFTNPGINRYGLAFDSIGEIADAEILSKCQISATIAWGCIQVLRGSGTGAAENGYIGLQYAGNLYISKFVNGVFSNLVSTPFTMAINTWYYLRFKAVGDSLKLKVWDASEAEPGAWDLETTDTSISAAGWAGIEGSNVTTYWDTFQIDDLQGEPAQPGDSAPFVLVF